MNNLFIMHTQYNLILACGIAKTRYKNCRNDLVLYAEFNMNDGLRTALEKSFDKVYYVNESFVPPQNPIKEDLFLAKCLKKSKEFLKNSYDNVFLSQERPYDTYILSKLSKHCDFKCYSVEEDVYYSVNNKLNGIGARQIKKSTLGKVRDTLKTVLFGKNKYYEDIYFYGMNSNYDGNYVLFPNCVRQEMVKGNLIEVTKDAVKTGIESLYDHITLDIPESEKYVLFYFDLIERYKNPDKIEEIVKYLLEVCEKSGMRFLYKYHPRETKGFDILKQSECAYEILTSVPGEKILAQLYGKNVLVAGNLTTALWVSEKLGYNVMSVVGIENKENTAAANALCNMGIQVINNTEDIKNYIKEM